MSVSLEDLFDKIWLKSHNTVGKGSSCESQIASSLRTAPKFARRFEDVHLWQDWTRGGNHGDHGVDLVTKDVHTRDTSLTVSLASWR